MSGVANAVGKVAGMVTAAALLVGAVATGNPALAAVAAKVGSIATIASPAAPASLPVPRKPPMTAINIFEDGTNAYILSDTAIVDPSGKVVTFASKAFAFPEVRMAIAVNGRPIMTPLIEAMNRRIFIPTQAAFLAGIPAAFADVMREVAKANPAAEATGGNATRLWIASYDMTAGKPRLHTIGNSHVGGAAPLMPGGMTEVRDGYSSPPFDPAVLPFGYIANPKKDGRRVIESQRRWRFPEYATGCGVGGHAELYTIGRAGVTFDRVATWPQDRVGEQIAS